jgi:hypothetical protein
MNGGKSQMRPERIDETLLVKYLLGDLSEEEQVRVEDRAFDDADYLGALEAAEADLIDTYVHGDLSQADRRRFERRFLASPERLKKVEFARALAQVAADAKTAESPKSSVWQTLTAVIAGWNPALRFAAATGVLIVAVGGSWLALDNRAMRSRVASLETERREFTSRQEEMRRQLAEERSRAAALGEQSQRPAAPYAAHMSVASLILLPGLTRGDSRITEVPVDASTQIVHIGIQLEARDDYPRFRVELRRRSGEEVLNESNLARRQDDGRYSVSFDAPASALPAGSYELALKGVPAGKPAEDVGYYYFSVVKKP